MFFDHPGGPLKNRVGGRDRCDSLVLRIETRRLPAFQCERSIALNRQNLHVAGGAGYQVGAVLFALNCGRSLGRRSGRYSYDVIADTHRQVRTFGEGIESDGSATH